MSDSSDKEYENPLAWGKSTENYYQQSDNEYSSVEEQADLIYKKHMEGLDEGDFNIATREKATAIEQQPEVSYSSEIKALSREIKSVVKHMKTVRVLKDTNKLNELFRKGGFDFLQSHISIGNSYLCCLMMLLTMYRNRQGYLEKHPIMKRLSELKDLYEKVKELFIRVQPKVSQMMGQEEEQEEQEEMEEVDEPIVKKKRKVKEASAIEAYLDGQDLKEELQPTGLDQPQDYSLDEDEDDMIEEGMLKYEEAVKKQKEMRKTIKKQNREKYLQSLPQAAFDQLDQNQARSINYTILKNKGLTRRRKTQPKSSRVKLRGKFYKAQIRQRAKGKVIYENPGRVYEGETNIKYGKLTGIKLK